MVKTALLGALALVKSAMLRRALLGSIAVSSVVLMYMTITASFSNIVHNPLTSGGRAALPSLSLQQCSGRSLAERFGPAKKLKKHAWKCPQFTGSTSLPRGCAGTELANGICLPIGWPPNRPFAERVGRLEQAGIKPNLPQTEPPYIWSHNEEHPNMIGVVRIDQGRQLFVDDFLVESTSLVRRFHAARLQGRSSMVPSKQDQQRVRVMQPGDPAVGSDAAMNEMLVIGTSTRGGGMFYDPKLKRYIAHLLCDLQPVHSDPGQADAPADVQTWACVTTSTNLQDWAPLEVLSELGPGMDSSFSVNVDYNAKKNNQRWKLVAPVRSADPTTDQPAALSVLTSANGMFWEVARESIGPAARGVGRTYVDRMLNTWVTAIGDRILGSSVWRHWSADSLLESHGFEDWTSCQDTSQPGTSVARFAPCLASDLHVPGFWHSVDTTDVREASESYGSTVAWEERKILQAKPTDLNDFSAFSYESLSVGLFVIRATGPTWPVLTDTQVGFSRNGFHYLRPQAPRRPISGQTTRSLLAEFPEPLMPVNQRYIQRHCSGGSVIVDRDIIRFYCTATPLPSNATVLADLLDRDVDQQEREIVEMELRRDGFASMSTPAKAVQAGAAPSELLTKPVMWQSGCSLWINADLAPGATLTVAVLDQAGKYELLQDSRPMQSKDSSTAYRVSWAQDELQRFSNFGDFASTPVRLRFRITAGSSGRASDLYSFWVSSDGSRGGSDGFIPGGSPAHPCGVDFDITW